MRRALCLLLMLALASVVAITPTDAAGSGQWRLDTVYPIGKNPPLPKNPQPGADVKGWWWLETAPANAFIGHFNTEIQILSTIPRWPLPKVVLMSPSQGALLPTVAADTSGNAGGVPIPDAGTLPGSILVLETDTAVVVVGGGGGGASWAQAVKQFIATTIEKPVRWLIVPDAYETSWTSALEFHTPGEPLTVFTSSAFLDAVAARDVVSGDDPASGAGARWARAAGAVPGPGPEWLPRDTDWRLTPRPAAWGGTLPCPVPSDHAGLQCVTIDDDQTLTLDNLVVRLINVLDDVGGLVTYLPQLQLLVPPGVFDGHLANTAPLAGPVVSTRDVLSTLTLMLALQPANPTQGHPGWRYYAPLRGVPAFYGRLPDGRAKGLLALQAQGAALQELVNYTIGGIRDGTSLDEIVAEAAISDTVKAMCAQFYPASPCAEWNTSLASVVKGIYGEYLGWFDGTARDLAAHLTPADKASLFVELAGGSDELLATLQRVTAAADTLPAIERALWVVEPLHELAPSPEIDLLYFQLLWKAGMSQTASDVRNYYLSLAWEHRPQSAS